MIEEDQIIPDDCRSGVGHLVAEFFRKHQPGFRGYREGKSELIEKLKDSGYIEFQGGPRRYHIQRVGGLTELN